MLPSEGAEIFSTGVLRSTAVAVKTTRFESIASVRIKPGRPPYWAGPAETGMSGVNHASIEVVSRPAHDVTVALVFRALTLEPELLPSLLPADALPDVLKERIQQRAN